MTDVFISYSRTDADFVRRLHTALAAHQRDTWVDWEDIPLTADWWAEIQAGIEAAHTFVFIISPESARSKVCFDEVEHAHANNKRIVPILHRDVTEKPDQERLHWSVNRHNWVFMRAEDNFDAAFEKLTAALDTDLDHVRQHTDLLLRARKWDQIGRAASPLLRGADLRAAEAWLASVGEKEPKPTDLQTAYVLASRRAANRFQRAVLLSVSAALIVVAALAILSFGLFRRSVSNEQDVQTQAAIAQTNEAQAISAQETSEAHLYEARRQRSLFMADLSQQQRAAYNGQEALALALEAVKHYAPGVPGSVFTTEGFSALMDAVDVPWYETLRLTHESGVTGAVFNRDQTRVLTWTLGCVVYVWDIASGRVVQQWNLDSYDYVVIAAAFSSDERYVAAWTKYDNAFVWDVETGQQVALFRYDASFPNSALWVPESHWLLTENRETNTLHLYHGLTGEHLAVLPHDDYVYRVEFSPDGRLILSTSRDGQARLWAAQPAPDGGEVAPLAIIEHETSMKGSVFSPDGAHVLVWSEQVEVWDTAQLEQGDSREPLYVLYTPVEEPPALWNVVFSPDGSRLFFEDGNGNGWMWRANGEFLFPVDVIEPIISADFNNDGTQLLTWHGEDSSRVRVWQVTDQATEIANFSRTDSFFHAEFAPDDTRVMTTGTDNSVKLWWPLTTLRATIWQTSAMLVAQHQYMLDGTQWTTTGDGLFTWSWDGTLRLWQPADPAALPRLDHTDALQGVRFNADGTRFVSWSADGSVMLWDAESRLRGEASAALLRVQHDNLRCPACDDFFVTYAAFNADETRLLTASRDSTARVWDIATGEELLRVAHQDEVQGAVFNADETRLLSWSGTDSAETDASARLWDVETGAELLRMQHGYAVRAAFFAANESRIITVSEDRSVVVWDATPHLTPAEAAALPPAGYLFTDPALRAEALQRWEIGLKVTGAALTADETRLLVWGEDGYLGLWEVATGEEVAKFHHGGFVTTATFSADETRVLSASTDGTARVWDLTGEHLPLVLEHEGDVRGAVFDANGERVLTWSDGSSLEAYAVALWDTTIPAKVFTHSVPRRIVDAAFDAGGTAIITWDQYGNMKRLPLDPLEWFAWGEALRTYTLRSADLEAFFLPGVPITLTPIAPTLTPVPYLTRTPTPEWTRRPSWTPYPTNTAGFIPSPTRTLYMTQTSEPIFSW